MPGPRPSQDRAGGLYLTPSPRWPHGREGRPQKYLWKVLDQCHRELDVGEAEEKPQPRDYPDCGQNHDDEREEPREHQEANGGPGHPLVAALGMGGGKGGKLGVGGGNVLVTIGVSSSVLLVLSRAQLLLVSTMQNWVPPRAPQERRMLGMEPNTIPAQDCSFHDAEGA